MKKYLNFFIRVDSVGSDKPRGKTIGTEFEGWNWFSNLIDV